MKKKRPQNYLKLVMLVIGVSLLLTTCEREDTDFIAYSPSEQSIEKGYTVKSVNLETVKENELVQESLELISSQFDFNKASKTPPSKNNGAYTTSALADPIKSKDNSFTILTDEILEVSTDSTKVYTFRIETSTKPDSYFENFVIHKKSNDSIDYFIYRYKKIGTTIEHLSMTKEQVNSDQINVGDFKDYTQGLVLYDPGSDCWFDITKQNGILIILIYDCSENGGLGGAGSIGTGGVGGYTSSYIFGGTIPNGQFLFGQWVITGVTPQGNCVINRPLLEMNGSPLRSLEGDLLYESLAVSCPSDSSSNDSSSDDQSWPWDNSSTDSNYDTLHGFGGGGSSTNTDGSDPNNPDEMVVAVLPPTPLELETTAFFDNLTDEQKECLNPGFGQPQNSLKKDITAYFKNNQVFGEIGYDDGPVIADEATAFATAAIEAVCDGGEVDWVNEVILDKSFLDNEKAKCVYDKLTADNSPLFRNTVGAFIDDPDFNLTFKVGNCSNTDDACTNDDDPNNIVIIIEDINITPVEMAQLILHEAIHAEIARYVAQYQSGVDVNDRSYLFELYKHYKNLYSSGDIDHIYMTLNYINPINAALREFDDNNFPSNYYGSFAWDGLRFWDAGDLLSIEEDTANALRRIEVIENSSVCQ